MIIIIMFIIIIISSSSSSIIIYYASAPPSPAAPEIASGATWGPELALGLELAPAKRVLGPTGA